MTTKTIYLVTTTGTLAQAMSIAGLETFNTGVYEGTTIPIRKMTGSEPVTIIGTSAGASVTGCETWITDRFGKLGARGLGQVGQTHVRM